MKNISKNNKTKSPTISIISPSLNLGRFLEPTIQSILNQSYTDYEHIVVDGGSTDNTLPILKKYPNIRWISEKDSGYQDALIKGMKMARGKYIMICMVSDGYVNKDWFLRCIEAFEQNLEISLVWGFPKWMTENGTLGELCLPHFKFIKPPQKYDWLTYWLATGDTLPNGNFCIKKKVFEICNPSLEKTKKGQELFDFNYNFNTGGYLPYNIPVVADFGREHEGQLSKNWAQQGVYTEIIKRYRQNIDNYRQQLISGKVVHKYKSGDGKILEHKFSKEKIRKVDKYKYRSLIMTSLLAQRGPYKLKKIITDLFRCA